MSRRRTFFSASSPASATRRRSATHRQPLHRCVRARSEKIAKDGQEAGGVPGAGHALSGRHRERVLHGRTVGDHQEPPQRRRPARAHEHAPRRAVARIVQGRGARPRPRPRDAETSSAAIPFPGRASPSAAPARSRRQLRHPAPGGRDLHLEEIRRAGLYDDIWQAFAVLLPVRTVGVMGDARTYDMSAPSAPYLRRRS